MRSGLCMLAALFVGLLLVCCDQVLAKWEQLGDNSPPERRIAAAASYCPGRDSMVMFGGFRVFSAVGRTDYTNDLWEFNFQTKQWREITVSGPRPSARVWTTLTSLQNVTTGECHAVLHGGVGRISNTSDVLTDFDDTWLLSLVNGTTEWTLLTAPNGPGKVGVSQAVYRRGTVVLFGGSRLIPPLPSGKAVAFNDIWTLTVGEKNETGDRADSVWVQTSRPSSGAFWPDARFSHAMAIRIGSTPSADELIVYGGRKYETDSEWSMLSDLHIYTFGTNTWRSGKGLKLERALHSAIVVNGRFVAFGGVTRIPTSPSTYASYVFNSVLVTNLDPSLNSNIDDASLGQPQCTAGDGKYGLWCVVDIERDEQEPSVRYDFAYVQRMDELVVYGGRFQDFLSDLWRINITEAVKDLNIAEADSLGASDLASTMYFMIAILSMMVVCFIVFVISLRRQRGNAPMFQGMMANRPRVVGARQSVIDALPLKTFKKKEADERRQSRRQSRIDSLRASKPAEEGGNSDLTSAAAMAPTTAVAPAADPSGDPIEDDLHDLCAICLTEYEDGEQLRVLPCEHFFHPDCVDQWLRTHNACPMCKASVDLDPDRSEEPNVNQQLMVTAEAAENPAFGQERAQSNATAMESRAGGSSVVDPEARPTAESSATAPRAAASSAAVAADSSFVVVDLSQDPESRPNQSANV